jgi:hypothetical protein
MSSTAQTLHPIKISLSSSSSTSSLSNSCNSSSSPSNNSSDNNTIQMVSSEINLKTELITSSSNHYLTKNDSNNNVKDLNNLIIDKLNLFKTATHMNEDEDDDDIGISNIKKLTNASSLTQNEVLNENNNHNNIMVDSMSFDNVKLNNNNNAKTNSNNINNIDLNLINTVHVCAAQVRRFDKIKR